ncbi:hypothetical protein HK101_003810, partial [Irineochytrium annulatum]
MEDAGPGTRPQSTSSLVEIPPTAAVSSPNSQDEARATTSCPWEDLGVILNADGEEVQLDDLPDKLGLYFTAAWSPACRDFTHRLTALVAPHLSRLAIIHIPSETPLPHLNNSINHPFHRLPASRPPHLSSRALAGRFKLLGGGGWGRMLGGLAYTLPLPSLVIVDRKERRVVTAAGVVAVNVNGGWAVEEWVTGGRGLGIWGVMGWYGETMAHMLAKSVMEKVLRKALVAFSDFLEIFGLDVRAIRPRIKPAEDAIVTLSAQTATTSSTSTLKGDITALTTALDCAIPGDFSQPLLSTSNPAEVPRLPKDIDELATIAIPLASTLPPHLPASIIAPAAEPYTDRSAPLSAASEDDHAVHADDHTDVDLHMAMSAFTHADAIEADLHTDDGMGMSAFTEHESDADANHMLASSLLDNEPSPPDFFFF